MSENANTKIVQNVYENFRAGDIKDLLNLLSDDIVWQLPETRLPTYVTPT